MIRLRLLVMIIRMIRPLVMIIMLLVMMICNEGRTSCCPGLCRPSLNTNFTLSLSHQHLVLVASTYQPTDQPKTFPTLPISMPNLLNPPPTQLNPPLLCTYFPTRTNRPTNLEVNLPMPSPPL